MINSATSEAEIEAILKYHQTLGELIDDLITAAEAFGSCRREDDEFGACSDNMQKAKSHLVLYVNGYYEKSLAANIRDND